FKAGEGIGLELEQRLGRGPLGLGALVLLVLVLLFGVAVGVVGILLRVLLLLRLVIFRRRRFVGGIGIDQAVDQLVDAHLVAGDLVGALEHLGDCRRAGGDRLYHVLEAVLDALGDLDLALAGQQFDRAHLAHVHAYRVGGAAEIGVDRRQGLFGFFLGDVLVDRARDA